MVRIVICGVCGRMGSRILELARQDDKISIAGLTEAASHPKAGKTLDGTGISIETSLEKAAGNADTVIDFTGPESTLSNIAVCVKTGRSMVIGTTGISGDTLEKIHSAAKKIPIVYSPNMSVGVNLLFKLTADAAKVLRSYDAEITEIHHNQKKDAPSGTAKKLAQVIADTLGRDLDKCGIYGRQGMPGARKPGEIGIHAVRAGDVVGEHTVFFAGRGERIEITHRALSRDTFAGGALAAAKWLNGKKPGMYDMQDVLGLK